MPQPHNFHQINDVPREEFEGLSPRLLHGLLWDLLGPGSPVKVGELTEDDLEAMPLLHLLRRLVGELDAREIKLTPKGNLPGKLVKAYYATQRLSDSFVEGGSFTIRGEDDYLALRVIKHLLYMLGWTKKRNGKLSLTKKGRDARKLAPREYFLAVFTTHARKFNLAYADGFAAGGELQFLFPYLLYLLQLLGKKTRPVSAYRERMWRAFPRLVEDVPQYPDAVLQSRLLSRFLDFYGLLDLDPGGGRERRPATVATNAPFSRVFYLDMEARTAPPPEAEAYDKQLKTALFDAETGGQSWVSDETPPELLEQFQASIRAIEERQRAGETVSVGSLLGELRLVPPEEATTDEIASRETARLTVALEKAGLLVEHPEGMPPPDVYAYLHDLVLPYAVVPPAAGQRCLIPVAEVLLAYDDPLELTAEAFLLSLFDLEESFDAGLLAAKVRLGPRMVDRERALRHVRDWRAQFTGIEPLAFTLLDMPEAPPTGVPNQEVCFFGVEYRVTHRGGRQETYHGEGLVQLTLEEEVGWSVSGAQFPGFEF